MSDLSWSEYITNAREDLWFLRPEWFKAFIPIGIIALLFIITHKRQYRWKRLFSKQLIPYLTIKGTKRQFIVPKLLLITVLSLLTLAIAGPTWEKIEIPGQKTEAALVVLLDLSRSMLAEDIQPNRIERAKLKLKDFFAAKPQSKMALIAYAGTAHSVVPFSKDYKTIERQMDALRPDIMPVQGSNLAEAMDMADSLLAPIIAPSTILIVTDNIKQDDIARISQSASHTHVEVMAIATPNGATIPSGQSVLKDKQGNTVIPKLEVINMNQLDEMDNVNIITVTLDDSDVKILAARLRQNLEFTIDRENQEDQWRDFGMYLTLPILLLSLFSFRRGWKVHWCFLISLNFACNEAGEFNLNEQFFTRDQQAQRLVDKGNYEEAAEVFQSYEHKGYAYYKSGELEKAVEAYSNDVSPNGFYNLGVLYSEMGDLESAQQAFNTAVELEPDFKQAQLNLNIVTKKIDSIKLAEGLPLDKSYNSKNNAKDFQEHTEVPGEKDVAQKSDEIYKGKGDVQEMVSKEVDENTIDVFEFDENAVIDKEQAKQTLLRQVTEDPSIFLRRKFAYQNKNRTKPIKKLEEDW